MKVAVLADTHGLLRPQVLERVSGCARILHAGDVGDVALLDQLAEVAPVTAVRGDKDRGAAATLPEIARGELGGLPFRMTHRHADLNPEWRRQVRLIVYGHSHRPEISWHGNCLLLNPGAVGPRRFKLPLTMARLTVLDDRIVPELLAVE